MPAIAHRGRGRRTMNEINMVPFIDVMLVLLIIFMVTAPMIAPSMIAVPSVGSNDAGKQPEQAIQVLITSDENLEVKSQESRTSTGHIAIKDIASTVLLAQGGDPTRPVVISADRNVKYDTVVQIMSRLHQAGVQRVGLAVQRAPS